MTESSNRIEKLTGLVVKIPKDFDLKLKQRLLDLEILGIKRTKADEIIKLAQIGLLKENLDFIESNR